MDYEGPDSAVEKVCCNRGIAKTTFFSPECVPEWVVSGTPFLSGTVCGTRFAPFFCPKTKDLSDNIKKNHQDLNLTHGKNITCKFCKTQQFAAGTSAPAAAAVAVARQTWQQR